MNPDEAHPPGATGEQADISGFCCPTCGALLYSRRSRVCGNCGTVLPPESVCTDAEVAARQAERQWARDLADKFDTTGQASHPPAAPLKTIPADDRPAAAEDRVRLMSCAAEFKYRKRPTWLYVIGCLVSLHLPAVLYWEASRIVGPNREALIALSVLGAINVFWWFVMWRRAMPVCPNCKQNIRTCLAEHCLVCGKPMSHGRCTDCGVDDTWIGWLHPTSNGVYRRITFCPGCGVELDTRIRRWRAGD